MNEEQRDRLAWFGLLFVFAISAYFTIYLIYEFLTM